MDILLLYCPKGWYGGNRVPFFIVLIFREGTAGSTFKGLAFTLPAPGVGKEEAMSANERRRQIMFYLNDYRKATCPLLAEYFQVSINTIRVDIEILTCEYPIILKKGKYGGISVPDEWRYDSLVRVA